MGQRVSSIFADIGLDASKFTSGAKGVMSGLTDMIGGLGKMGGVAGILVTALGFTVKTLDKFEKAAVNSARESAKLGAILKSTGYSAGLSADDIDTMTQRLSKLNEIDDEVVSAAESVLLTFTNVKKDAFEATTQAAINMAAVLGGDVNGKITMVGKAMNDFTGYTALKRAGVSFSEEQLKQIANFKKTNDLVGYQKLLLGELSTEYGGAAAAMADAGDHQEALSIAWGNYQESAGEGMITLKRQWNDFLIGIVDGMTKSQDATSSYNKAMQELGISASKYGWLQDGVKITRELAEAAIQAQIALDNEAKSIESDGEAAEMTDEQLKELSDTNKGMISMVGTLTGQIENYDESMRSLQEQLDDGSISSDEFKTKTEELSRAQEIATNKMILGYAQELLAADGLTKEEMQYLLDKGVAMGVYSKDAVAKMQEVIDQAGNLAGAINGIPGAKDITITTYHQDVYVSSSGSNMQAAKNATSYSGGNGSSSGLSPLLKTESGIHHLAGGGSFIVPSSFGYEGFGLGGIATASAGEKVTVTPTGKSSSGATININVTGNTLLGDSRTMAKELARIIQPELNSLVRLNA